MYLQNKNQASPGAGADAVAKSITPCYNIGDTGPAGGIIVSIPGVGQNTSNFLYEMAPAAIHTATIPDTGVDYSCNGCLCGGGTGDPDDAGVEFGCWNQNINSQFGTNTSHEFGEGSLNTQNVINNSNNTCHFNSGWTDAFSLVSSYSLGGFDDWFLPSVEEVREASDNGYSNLANPGGAIICTSSGYKGGVYSTSELTDLYPGLIFPSFSPDTKCFFSFKPHTGGLNYYRDIRGRDVTVVPMRRFTCVTPGPCSPCSIVYASGPATGYPIKIYMLSDPFATPVALTYNGNPNFSSWLSNTGWAPYAEITKFGNKIWVWGMQSDPNSNSVLHAVCEFIIGSNCAEVTLSKIMPLSVNSSIYGQGMDIGGGSAIDSTTIIANVSMLGAGWHIVEVDVSGANAIGTQLFPSGTPSSNMHFADFVYIPSSNSILGANYLGDVVWMDYSSGAIIDQQNYPAINSFAMFCYQGTIYMHDLIQGQPTQPQEYFEVDISGGVISLSSPISNMNYMGDAASNPECCPGGGPPEEPPCFYNIGDVGPGGGIIFITPTSVPGQNFYYEIAMNDVITSNTTLAEFQTVPSYINPTYINTPASPAGAEWGAYKSPISLSATSASTIIGAGHLNTSTIVNHPQCTGTPCHPLISNNFIAAELCSNYNGGGMSDWYLASTAELWFLLFNSQAFNDSLYPGNGQYALSGMHWTSSAVHAPNDIQVDSKAWAWDTDGWPVAYQGYRDKKLSVRPIRRFECPACPDGDPSCVDYNWVDGAGNLDGGCLYASSGGHPWPQYTDSIIGGDNMTLFLSSEDVLGNIYTSSMFNNGDEVTIKVWKHDYTYLGTWKYTILYANPFYACYNDLIHIIMDNVVHLDGPNQYIDTNYSDSATGTGTNYGSATQTFLQVITPATATTGLANGTQTTMWGNLPYTGFSWSQNELASRCMPDGGCLSCPPPGQAACLSTYTVSPIYAGQVYQDRDDCINSAGIGGGSWTLCCGQGTSTARPSAGYKKSIKKSKDNSFNGIITNIEQLKNYNPEKEEPCEDCGKQ